jgi:DNA end-binding protein Ku
MLDLAKHINTKKGSFDAKAFDDRYEEAVAELVKAKIEGRALPKKKAPAPTKTGDLLQALRESAGMGSPGSRSALRPRPGRTIIRQKPSGGSPIPNERLNRRVEWRCGLTGKVI